MKEGWKYLLNSTKWHYFVEGRSLCGKWATFGNDGLEQGNDESEDNCAGCRKKFKSKGALKGGRK